MSAIKNIKEIVLVFLKLSIIAFGGPAAHIAMMMEEVIDRRNWMTREHFLDLVGITNLIPGPNSTQMVMHCGLHRGNIAGLIAAGVSFIVPACLITGVLAYIYFEYSDVPEVERFLFGIKPAVIAIILGAVYKLGRKALKNWQLGVLGTGVAVASLMGVNEFVAIIAGGIIGIIWLGLLNSSDHNVSGHSLFLLLPIFLLGNKSILTSYELVAQHISTEVSLGKLFFIFTKISLVLFGSGYVLVAYLEGELVQNLGWLTEQQLLDAIAIGQFTPGPLLSTATFIGYQISGFWGAVVASVGIFLPSFVLVAIINPLVPRLRKSETASIFMDSVNISAMGIMAAVTLELGHSVLADWKALIIFLLSCTVTLLFKKVSSFWIVIGGAVLGYLLMGI